ncbi:hypothetical protein HanOQP8_Chr03g0122551 [Helianthus annuus]|nr:hypothetical protein HanOQP8_Chr03g0122551 [Helianthus annuus]
MLLYTPFNHTFNKSIRSSSSTGGYLLVQSSSFLYANIVLQAPVTVDPVACYCSQIDRVFSVEGARN